MRCDPSLEPSQRDSSNDGLQHVLTLLHSEGPKLYGVLAVLSAIGMENYP